MRIRIAWCFPLFLAAGCGAEDPGGAALPATPLPATPLRRAAAGEFAGSNLILVAMDACRTDRASFHPDAGGGLTPGLHELAQEAAVFADCTTASTLGGPSHLSVFTGQWVHRHGKRNNVMDAKPEQTLAGILAREGWSTAGFAGGGPLRRRRGLDPGFEVYQSAGGLRFPNKTTFAGLLPEALAWLEEHEEERSFLFLQAFDAHCPYRPPEPFYSDHAGWYFGPDQGLSSGCGDNFELLIRGGELRGELLKLLNSLYDGGVAAGDASLQGFFEKLRARGLLERSILVFYSAHGESLAEHDQVGHGQGWEEQMRVPLFVRFPGGRYAGLRDDPVSLVDLLPTLLDALGVPVPAGVQGSDLMPLLEGGVALPADRIRPSQQERGFGVHFGKRWKLHFEDRDGNMVLVRLFDLEADPLETLDLAQEEEGAARAEQLLRRWRAWRERQDGSR